MTHGMLAANDAEGKLISQAGLSSQWSLHATGQALTS